MPIQTSHLERRTLPKRALSAKTGDFPRKTRLRRHIDHVAFPPHSRNPFPFHHEK
jgi:hypothetical protein